MFFVNYKLKQLAVCYSLKTSLYTDAAISLTQLITLLSQRRPYRNKRIAVALTSDSELGSPQSVLKE